MTQIIEKSMPKSPKYLVLFEDNTPENVNSIYRSFGMMGTMAEADSNGIRSIPALHETSMPGNYYDDIGVAALDLTDDEAANLEGQEGVAMIVENEIRNVPPYEVMDSVDTQEATSAQQFSWPLQNIGLNPQIQLTGEGIKVAVLDTGIDLNHPDFANQHKMMTLSFVPGETVQDANGHGTHCAGVIAAKSTPASGPRYSVAPEAELLIGKVLSNQGSGYDNWIINGIQWAARNGASVISMSLGSARALNAPFHPLYERIAARLLSNNNVLLVAAAGNSSNRPTSREPVGNPGACPSILAVAAVDKVNHVARFSCAELDTIGTLDISAPGVAIHSAWPGGGYKSISGTSMACPHVAGVACLHFQQNPGANAQTIWSNMMAPPKVRPLPVGSRPQKDEYGHGLVQV